MLLKSNKPLKKDDVTMGILNGISINIHVISYDIIILFE